MERKDRRSNDDVPIIGDYSAEYDARRGADSRRDKTAPRADAPDRIVPERIVAERRTPERGAGDNWRHDPTDMRRQRRRMGMRGGKGTPSAIGRYALVAAVLAAVAIGYLNFDAVRQVGLDVVSRVVHSLAERSTSGDSQPPSGAPEEPETVVVEGGGVAGTEMPSAIGGAPQTEEAATPAETEQPAPAARAPFGDDEPVAAAAPPEPEPVAEPEPEPVVPAAPPAPPPGPETFELAAVVVNVSEAAASARVLVLRGGDRSQVSTVVWSTRDGTATAGSDYVDRGAVVERFAAGEQNRTILVPIIGDRNAEGPENFYVVLVSDEGDVAGEVREAEVVIDDDD